MHFTDCNFFSNNIESMWLFKNLGNEVRYLLFTKRFKKKEIVLEELKAKETEKTSIKEIELKAKELLNMDYPKDGQIKYIDVDN
ncbi:hypothetical protein ACK2FX_09475 [Clostridioides difficile]|nr:hypothetical protein [Clostridioides difficile]